MIIKLAWKEIKSSKAFSLLFIVNLSLGLLGLGTLYQAKQAFDSYLQLNAKKILGADLDIGSRHILRPKQLAELESVVGPYQARIRTINLYTMVQALEQKTSRLIRLKAVSSGYPFYGGIKFSRDIPIAKAYEELREKKGIWIYEELAQQFQLKIGQKLKIGNNTFIILNIVLEDSTDSFSDIALAPRAYLHIDNLWSTSLVKKGSTLFEHYLYQFESSKNSELIAKSLENKIKDTSIRFNSPQSASDNMERVFGRMNDYLGLISLVAFFLACLGLAYLFRSFINSRSREVAVFRTLGLELYKIYSIFLIQLSFLSTIATVISFIGIQLLLPFLMTLFFKNSYLEYIEFMSPAVLFVMLVAALLFAMGACIPDLRKLGQSKLAWLLSDLTSFSVVKKSSIKDSLIYLPLFIVFAMLSVLIAKSVLIGLGFVTGLILGLLAISSLGHSFIILINKLFIQNKMGYPFKQCFLYLSRKKAKVKLSLIALGFGVLLLNFIIVIENGLYRELDMETGGGSQENLPSLFLFDIQPEQIDDLKALVKSSGSQIQNITPLVRARLIKVNGREFERLDETEKNESKFRTREEESSSRMRNRGMNLTYKMKPDVGSDDAQIISGRAFEGHFTWGQKKPIEISLEERFATRLNLKLGDQLLFDIQGIELEGVVIALRKVRWTSFKPNFFVELQPGGLEDAPQTYLATLPKMDMSKRSYYQKLVPEYFPNVSLIDVSRALQKMLSILDKVKVALEGMIYFALVSGIVVVLSITNNEAFQMIKEFKLMRLLGSTQSQLFIFTILIFSTVGIVSGLVGGGIGILMGAIFLSKVFMTEVIFPYFYFIKTLGFSVGLSVLSGVFALLTMKSGIESKYE